MKATLQQIFPEPIVQEAGSIEKLQALLMGEKAPDLILLDLHIPGAYGFSGLIYVCGHYPKIPVAIVSASEDLTIISRAINHGAMGFIPKSLPLNKLNEALNNVITKRQWLPDNVTLSPQSTDNTVIENKLASLTPQQFRVLGMISEGLLNKQIAYDLNVSEATIKAHITAIFKKLGVRNRTQAVITIKSLEIEPPQQPEKDQ